ncbi:hypothetical protein DLM45_09750 [Hyphomicrobium methylovorum]|uniref:DUF2852 domain-containing protein n=1 Tax=Hyphomicrobium methylovorum TaxID=84 RepID=UPI0015E68F61|nr:DUF2852 domain-containing protein [Hyphomicrobium methylovorum]MBA2126502.1 hypothetical protein [Hyphomicrobium methylovorum]
MAQVVQTLDDFGKPAWILAAVLGFVVFWPVGLAVLAYLIWSGRMSCGWHGVRGRWESRLAGRFDRARNRVEDEFRNFGRGGASSGNKAFDDYREATLKRLEEEEREFHSFLNRLRQAKDKSEFDQFMSERRDAPDSGAAPAV